MAARLEQHRRRRAVFRECGEVPEEEPAGAWRGRRPAAAQERRPSAPVAGEPRVVGEVVADVEESWTRQQAGRLPAELHAPPPAEQIPVGAAPVEPDTADDRGLPAAPAAAVLLSSLKPLRSRSPRRSLSLPYLTTLTSRAG